jgi:hypothetical protein
LIARRHAVLRLAQPDRPPLAAARRVLAPVATRPQQWEFAVDQTGDQTITLSGTGRITVTIYVPPLGQSGR